MRLAALSALFLGLAVMTKGPVGFLIFALTFAVWLVYKRFRFSFRWKDVAVFLLVFALVGGSWSSPLPYPGMPMSSTTSSNTRYAFSRPKTPDTEAFLPITS